jgi:O-acetyl-ADP-ribose deacetylase (regulator of RNase III)
MTGLTISETRLSLTEGDITTADTAAIVNAANARLIPGGGVDGAIHRVGGPDIKAEARRFGGCPTGEAVITTAGRLKADKVIHTVGPVYRGSPEDARLLASAYRSSLDLAARHGLRSVAFPSLSTGAYGYPLSEAARVALAAVKEGILANEGAFDEVRFVLFGSEAFSSYSQVLSDMA